MANARLCVTVTGATTAELRKQRDGVVGADLVELRLDTVADPSPAGALAGRHGPVIVTCRPAWEGGQFAGSEEERKRILLEAWALGADYVDIEWRARFDDVLAHTGGRRVLVSAHDFDGMPSDLASRVGAMRATGADAIKIAVTPHTLADCVPLSELQREGSTRPDLIVVGMGSCGTVTRILAAHFGSAWTYAGALREIGQLDADMLLDMYRFKAVTRNTRIYGIVGGSIAHSVSPAIHTAAFRNAAIDAVYVPLPAVDADDFVRFGRAFGIKGASVTIPHKVALVDRMDEVDAIARRVGAINTIRDDDGRWIATNTDVHGFLAPLQRIALPGLRASVLGAGGAARAVAIALASAGCSVSIHARSRGQAAAVASLVEGAVAEWPPAAGSWDLLVNATPLGTHPHVNETPVPKRELTGRYVYDLVYNPPETRLLREAADRGCVTIGGLDMLVAQAAEQFQWWTGAPAPVTVMREAALGRLGEFARNEHYVA